MNEKIEKKFDKYLLKLVKTLIFLIILNGAEIPYITNGGNIKIGILR